MKSQIYALHKGIQKCKKCRLSKSRKNAVPGEGALDTPLLIVGEAPGRNEDLLGRPFVGAAGDFLNQLLSSINIDRSKVFITNIVKCRPPENRPPRIDEVRACHPYIEQQIRLIDPKIVCLMGVNAIRGTLGKGYLISKMHGNKVETADRNYFLTYHPAAVLYTNQLKEIMINDFKNLSGILRSSGYFLE